MKINDYDLYRGWPGYAPQFDDSGDAWASFKAGVYDQPQPFSDMGLAYEKGKAWREKLLAPPVFAKGECPLCKHKHQIDGFTVGQRVVILGVNDPDRNLNGTIEWVDPALQEAALTYRIKLYVNGLPRHRTLMPCELEEA